MCLAKSTSGDRSSRRIVATLGREDKLELFLDRLYGLRHGR